MYGLFDVDISEKKYIGNGTYDHCIGIKEDAINMFYVLIEKKHDKETIRKSFEIREIDDEKKLTNEEIELGMNIKIKKWK